MAVVRRAIADRDARQLAHAREGLRVALADEEYWRR